MRAYKSGQFILKHTSSRIRCISRRLDGNKQPKELKNRPQQQQQMLTQCLFYVICITNFTWSVQKVTFSYFASFCCNLILFAVGFYF